MDEHPPRHSSHVGEGRDPAQFENINITNGTLQQSNNDIQVKGCIFSGETDHLRYNTDKIDMNVLQANLNKDLFFEVYTSVLDSLHMAFEEFKKDEKYLFLREDIRR